MTAEDVDSIASRTGLKEDSFDYNVMIDGHGTGLAPPTQGELDSLVGNAIVVDSGGPADPGIPSSYDLSTQPYFPAVGNQGSQGSCAAWASTYYVYGYIEARNRNYTSAYLGTNSSQLMSPAWTYNRANGGLNAGSWMTNCLRVVCDWGVPSLTTMPYNVTDYLSWGTPLAFREAPLHKAVNLTEYLVMNQEAVDVTKSSIARNLPLTFALDASYISNLPKDSNGNYVLTASAYDPSQSVNHAQTVVGYDDSFTFAGSPDVGAFKIVNSWGTGFANKGYYWITYAAYQEMSTNGGFGLVGVSPKISNSPSMLAVFHFNAQPTRNSKITLGIGSQSSPLQSITPYYRTDSSHYLPTFLCLDISSFKAVYDAGTTAMWMKVTNGGTGAISSFKIESYVSGYSPGCPTLSSYQSPSVPATTPGTASIDFVSYASKTTNQAMDAPTISFASSGQARWTSVLSPSYYGGSAMQSGDVGDSGSSVLQATVSNLASASFYWKASTQLNQDFLRFYIDGTLKASISGEVAWQQRSYTLDSSAHVLRWEWSKDSSISAANDTVWLDRLELVPSDQTAPNLVSAVPGNAQVALTWTAPAIDGITGYKVYRGNSPGTESLLTALGNVLTYTNTGLTNGQAYYFKVSAVSSGGESPLSNELSAQPATVPTAPSLSSATPGNGNAVLAWTAPSSNGGSSITGYKVYRGTVAGAESLLTALGNLLTFTDTGLSNGQTYYYKVSAVNSIGEGPLSNELAATPATVPGAPTLSSAAPGNSQVVLSWSAPASNGGAALTGYKIYRGTSSGSEAILTTVGIVLTFTDTGLTNGQAYYYRIAAVNSVGEGAQSNERSATPVTIPAAPSLVTAAAGNAQVALTWSAPSSNGGAAINGYKVYRGTTSGGEAFLTTLGNVLTYTDSAVTNGQSYYYKVSAMNSVGESPLSNELGATPASVPSAPTLSSATPSNGQAVLAWSAPASNGGFTISSYKVYRGTSSGAETLLTTLGNVLAFTDTGLTNGQTYYYKVSAVNSAGEGALSNELSAIPATVPTAPNLASLTPGNAQAILSWTAPSSNGGSAITGYKVYRGTSSGAETLLVSLGNVLIYTDTALENGQTYYYKVSAVNSMGTSAQSNELGVVPSTIPSAPSGVLATSGNTQVVLTWSSPSNGGSAITGYKVYRGTSSGGESLLTSLGNMLTYTDAGLTNGQTYFYKVSAINANGEGAPSSEVSAVPKTVPSAPNLTSATPGNAQVTLVWSAPNNGGSAISGYKVYRGTSPGGEVLLTTLGNILTYTNTGLTNGQAYYYRISALNAVGEGALSNELGATPATVPSAPILDSITAANAQVTLGWTAPSGNGGSSVIGYKVYRGTLSGGESLLATLGNVLTFTDSGLTNGQAYYYRISASNSIGEGPLSNELGATPTTVPGAPALASATPGDSQIVLAWSAPSSNGGSSVTSYKVYRGTQSGGEALLATLGNVLSYTDATVSNGQTYYYKVSAVNSKGEGAQSNERSATPASLPSAIEGLAASAGNAEIILTWSVPASDGGSAIVAYKVYRGTSPGGENLLTTLGNVLTFTNTGLVNGQTYYYKVSAVNSIGEGARSSEASATPSTVPSAPALNSAAPGNGQIALAWSVPSSDGGSSIIGYNVYRGTTSGGEALLVELGNVLTFTDSGLSNGQAYFYKVSAVNSKSAKGEGPLSNELSATPATSPSSPTLLSAAPGDSQIVLSWSAPSNNGGSPITSYKVYRGTSLGLESLLTTVGNVLSYTDSSASNGQSYYYKVSAVSSMGEGAPSNELSARPLGRPSAPQALHASPGDGFVNLTWQAPSSDGGSAVTSYRIMRGLTAGAEASYADAGLRTWFNDTGLANGQSYYYKVMAVNSVGEGPSSDEAHATPTRPVSVPSAPQGLAASAGNAMVELTWTTPSSDGGASISGYKVYRGGAPGAGSWLATLGDVLSFSDDGVSNGATYYYTVSAMNTAGEGPRSTEAVATPLSVPGAPTLSSAIPGNAHVVLTWSAPTDDGGMPVTNYNVLRGTASGGEALLVTLGDVLTYTDVGLTNGRTYYYTISAVNAAGASLPSNELGAIPVTVPSAPVLVTASSGNSQVSLSWAAPSSEGGASIIGYNVYRGTSSGGEALVATLGGVLAYVDNGLANGQAYYYTVSAVNSVGEGSMSNELSSVPAALPSAPALTSATPGDSEVRLSWDPPASDGGFPITGYRLYRGISPESLSVSFSLGAVRSYADTGLTNGQTYYYRLSALNQVGEGATSAMISARPATVPGAPEQMRCAGSVGRIDVTWASPADDGGDSIVSYLVYRGMSASSVSQIASVGSTGYQDLGLPASALFYYEVRAVNSLGNGPSACSSAITAGLPGAPEGLSAVTTSASANLSWSAPSSDGGASVASYNVYRGPSASALVLIATVYVQAYQDNGLAPGTTYHYAVSALNGVGEGPLCTDLQATTRAVPPSAPQGIEAQAGAGHIDVVWEAPSSDGGSSITGYRVYRGSVPGALGLLTETFDTFYADQEVSGGQTLYYQVKAVNAAGEGAPSSTVSAKLIVPPSAPTGLQAIKGKSNVRLSWNAPSQDGGDTNISYVVYRGTASGQLIRLAAAGAVLEYLDSSLPKSGTLYYCVAAKNSMGEGPSSAEVSVVISKKPSAPKNPNALGKDQEVMLSWEAPDYDADAIVTGYAIYRAVPNGTSVLVAEVNATSLSDLNLVNGVPYIYGIASVNDAGQSDMCYVTGVPLPPLSGEPPIGGLLSGANGLALVMIIAAGLGSIAIILRRNQGRARGANSAEAALRHEALDDRIRAKDKPSPVRARTVRTIKISSDRIQHIAEQAAFDRNIRELEISARK